MPATRITNFGGIVPRLSPRQLPGVGAREAANVSLTTGELQPLRKSTLAWSVSAAIEILSFYRIDDSAWLGWPTAGVRMEPAALQGEARYVFTGDGVPRITTRALAIPATAAGEPAAARTLGIPAPQTAPGVIASGGVGATVTRFFVYTFYSDWNEESAPSPVSPSVNGKIDGSWSISGMDATPPNSGTITAAVHAGGVVTITLAQNHFARAGDKFVVASVGGMTDLNGPHTILGTPAANQITVSLTTAQAYTAGGTWARVHPWGACTKRLYRTAGNVADFQLVAENITGTSYVDTLTDAQIPGDSILSQGWQPPPTDLVGLVALSNGVLAGFRAGSRTICMCEPYQPHAWPESYRKTVPDLIVGVGAYDATLVVATAGSPVVFSGLEPAQMTPTRHARPLPALSAASICSISNAVVYASRRGLVRVDLAGADLFSSGLWSAEGWDDLDPQSIACAYDGARLLVSTQVNRRLFLIDLSGGEAQMVSSFLDIASVRSDGATGDLFYSIGNGVYRFDAEGAAPMALDWWSKDYVLAKPSNMGVARVELDAEYSALVLQRIAAERVDILATNQALIGSALGGRGGYNSRAWGRRAWNASQLAQLPASQVYASLTFYVQGRPVFSKTVPDGQAFRLPGGFKADVFSVRIQSNTQVKAVCVADTPRALAEV